MNHLLKELAPITDEAWVQIEDEAKRSITHFLAARRLVDFDGPLGWSHSSIDLGRIEPVETTSSGAVEVARRRVLPLVELRTRFSLDRSELAAADRGATDLDLDAVIEAGRHAALAEDSVVFDGSPLAGVTGIIEGSPHAPISIGDDYSRYPQLVASAVATLRAADIGGPYAIALGARCYTGVIETTEHGGYPVFEHLRQILDGPVIWAPAVNGAVVLSQRGGDFTLSVGQDFALGYEASDASSVDLYIEETVAFHSSAPEAAVHLSHD